MKSPTSFARLKSTNALMQAGIELMKEERQAIVSGSFDLLDGLTKQKTDLLNEIESRFAEIDAERKTDETESRRSALAGLGSILNRRAAENLSLLESAKRGVNDAIDTINGVEAVDPNPGFYNAAGHKIASTQPTGYQSIKI